MWLFFIVSWEFYLIEKTDDAPILKSENFELLTSILQFII